MRRLTTLAILISAAAWAQRGGNDWSTDGNDAHRSFWLRTDPKINTQSIQRPDFKFLWKVKTGGQPSAAVTLNSYIGYRGFRSLTYVVGSAGNVTAIDTDLGRIEWQKSIGGPAAQGGTAVCPGGVTAGLARPTVVAFPSTAAGRGGGRGGAAKSAVGEPGEGAVIIKEVSARATTMAPPVPPAAGRGRGAAPGSAPGFNPFARGPQYVYLISADGMLHAMYVSNGEEPNPPTKFLPANADARGLIVVDNVAYVATLHGCGGTPDQIWALDLASKEVTTWNAGRAGIAGTAGVAFGPDSTLYVATGDGALFALEPKTLKPKDGYKAGAPFATSPVVFQYKDRTLIAAATADGNIHLIDGANPSAAVSKSSAAPITGALASWQDPAGTRWLLGAADNAVKAWKVADENGVPSLQSGWTSREMISPLTPAIVNGVVFAVSAGSRSAPAEIYALDGANGHELWNSGKTITSMVRRGGGLAIGNSQLYLGADDGTLYTFGFWMEH